MNGTDLLNEFERRLMKSKGTKSVTDAVLAKEIGVTQAALANYREKELTPRQVVNLMEKFAKKSEKMMADKTVATIVEFLHLNPVETNQAKNWQIFSAKDGNSGFNPYLSGLRKRLEHTHGIYIFHDSRGRAIYAGKAQRQSLWAEMNSAFNRNRGEVQYIKRVGHPITRLEYGRPEEKKRQIVKEPVTLHHIANYMSAYEVPDSLIGKFEALIVRSFANDLLNVRMENF